MAEPANTGIEAAGGQGATRCGFIAVIGPPNAGKSTLVNQMVGSKVSIVTHKVQTTRVPVRGIAIDGASQLVFIDTPGIIFAPRRRLDRAMVEAAWTGAGEADVVVLILDSARGLDEDAERIIAKLAAVRAPKLLVLNKVDRLKSKDTLLKLAADISSRAGFEAVFMISALAGDGVADLKAHLARSVPEGLWHYPEDDVSDLPVRKLAAEITREKVYLRLHDELPYAITVETTAWKALRDGSVRVEQTVFVERESQRKIVLGKGGVAIKHISQEARQEIGALIEQTVHLFVFVKVREHWSDDPERYREMGLEFPRDEG
jgi:GTP-binding protein Era